MSYSNYTSHSNYSLEIKNLSKTYKSKKADAAFTLDNVSLRLPAGCIMGLVGENGAGKSTVIKLILDQIERDNGEIVILGRDNRENIALTKQDLGIVPDEIGLPEFFTTKHVAKMMQAAYTNWDDALFHSYLERFEIPSGKKFKSFSKGMKMKLGIAVALSHDAKLLILDEATSGLDPVVRDEITSIFSDFTRDENRAVLMSSHIVSDLEKICDYIAFLHKGRLMLCEEKDVLISEYSFVRGTREEINALPRSAVIGRKDTPYGSEAIVHRDSVPAGMESGVVNLEDLFIFMVRQEDVH